MKNIISKFPDRLHEDWRYYPLDKKGFEKLIDNCEPELSKVSLSEKYKDNFNHQLFCHSEDSFLEAVELYSKKHDYYVFKENGQMLDIDLCTSFKQPTVFRKENVVVEEGISAYLSINYGYLSVEKGLVDSLFNIVIKENATLTVYINGNGGKEHFHFLKFFSNLEKSSKLNIFNLQTSESTVRGEYSVSLTGDNSEVNFYQAFISAKYGFNEVVAKIFHKGLDTKSNLNNLSYVAGKSKSVLNGLLKVEENASFAKAYQSAKSYLLSEDASSVSYPQLEIENPDVECSHGSAVLSFDESQLFYLQSRGLSKKKSSEMVLKGTLDFFFKEIENIMKDEFIAKGHKKIEELNLWN